MRRVLASGVLGPVLAVEDDDGDDLLALKLIQTVSGADAEALAAALQPLVAPSLEHPGLLTVLAVGADPRGAYLVMPLLDVPTLEARLRGGRQTVAVVLEWLGPVATGLQHAHASGVLHGALHPRDILLARPHAVLTGVGVIPALDGCRFDAPVRVPFTAPERAAGHAWGAAADQYSLAMLALDALSGRRLVAGTIPAFDRWTLADTPAEDARLHEVFARALHPDPEKRFGSIADWLDALAGAAGATSELSRFTRDGVVPASVAAGASRVVSLDTGPEPLDLFASENLADGNEVDETASAAATDSHPGRDPEWLVAALPDEPPFDPAQAFEGARSEETLYAPIGDAAEDQQYARASSADLLADTARAPEYDLADERPRAMPLDADDLPLGSAVAGTAFATDPWDDSAGGPDDDPVEPRDRDAEGDEDEAVESWGIDEPVEDEGGSRPLVILTLVALAVLAVGYGTWRSMSGDPDGTPASVATTTDRTAQEPPAEPTAVTEEAIVPSREELEPGAPVVERPPAASTPAQPTPSSAAPAPRAGVASPPAGPAAASAPAREPSADVEGRGRVLIRASPAGEVRVNGRDYGTTPVVLRDLAFGSYVVTITRPGFETVVREVDLLASQPVASIAVDLEREGSTPTPPVTSPPPGRPGPSAGTPTSGAPGAGASLQTGSLLVVSRPAGARVTVDGRDYGTTPVAIPGLAEGRHVIRLELPGHRTWEGIGAVQAGQRVRVEAALVQGPR